ncbi:MAG: T9SS type A sorting domain-containing protein [Bacteroidota bacterium]
MTVRDTKPPTAICNNGISVDLMEMSGGTGVIEVDPRMIDASSSDNCTPRSALQFSLSPSRFTCENLGVNTVVFTVTDASGNTASCTTQIVIQDNDNGCPQNGMAALAGYVHNEMGERVENVRISVNGNQSNSQMTDVSGAFRFDNLPLGGDYTIAPRKTTHADNGVTTFDLVLMTKHVLGLQLFDSPYKLIAADINRNGKVTTFDIVQLRKLILGIIDDFPSNDSWRFVDASHVFTNPADPFIDQIPEVRSYNNVVESDMTADFVAVKIGDVNNSALMDATSTTVEERSLGRSTFWTDDQMIRAGEQVAVTLHASGQELLQGYQLAFKYDEDVLSWMSLGADEQTNIGAEHFNFARASEGVITTSWHQATTAVHELASPNKALFTLIFQAKADAQLSEILMLDNTILRAESYWGTTAVPTPTTVDLQFRIADSSPPVVLYQNQPNPFDQQTDITFYLPEAMAVNLSIFDLNGRLLWSKQAVGVAGLQQMKVNASTLEQRGVLYYRLSTQMGAVTKKMIVY